MLDHQTHIARETPLHLLSGLNPAELLPDIMSGMCRVAQLILEQGADTRKKDVLGNNCLHRAILSDNIHVFRELLKASRLALDDRNKDDHVPLWLALQQAEQMRKFILLCSESVSKETRLNRRLVLNYSELVFPFEESTCVSFRSQFQRGNIR